MKHSIIVLLLLLLLLVLPCSLWAEINPEQILFGLEATFQDREIVNEPGRMTFETPHKKEKFDGMVQSFLQIMQAPQASVRSLERAYFKPGVKITLPNKDEYIVDMEPVCIEWNQRPLKIDEIEKRWQPVYEAARRMNLVPYVNPAAERSGMGHIHVGGRKVAESPFFANPLLLRNVMVYFHQHPSLLWGFAEAFDIGKNSNIETLHLNDRQEKFEAAVQEFDLWYENAPESERVDGAFKFLKMLKKFGGSDFFQHYRFINLEHVARLSDMTLAESGELTGKYTVEFRNIRPYKSPRHAQAMAQLLLDVFTPLAKAHHKVPFRRISVEEYRRFHSSLVTLNDWTQVKSELRLKKNPLWENMIREYTSNLLSKQIPVTGIRGLTIAPAYSEKTLKGQLFELILPYSFGAPELRINNQRVQFQSVTDITHRKYLVTVVNTDENLKAEDLVNGSSIRISYGSLQCRHAHRTAL